MSGRAWNEDEVGMLRQLVEQKYSAAEIAREMDKTRSQILGYCHRHKIELARRKTDEPMKDQKPKKKPERQQTGNGHFNLRRSLELAKEPQTVGDWPKPETEHSVDIMEAGRMHCRMPLWGNDKTSRTGKICGKERLSVTVRNVKMPKSPYCPSCHPLAYSPYIRS